MNDRDILRHDRLDRVSTFGSENHADLPAGCEAIPRFANLATLSAKLARHKVGQLRGPASLQTLLDALSSDFKDIARTARAIDLDQPGFAAFYRLPTEPTANNLKTHADSLLTRLDAMMQNLYRRHPAKLHAWLAASHVERSPQHNKDTGNSSVGTTPSMS